MTERPQESKRGPLDIDNEEFRQFARKQILSLYRNCIGWRRFFIRDWWLLKLDRPRKEPIDSTKGDKE